MIFDLMCLCDVCCLMCLTSGVPVRKSVVFWDCEWLSCEGALSRLWGGPCDPDPLVIQMGFVRLNCVDLSLSTPKTLWVLPKDRDGVRVPLDDYVVNLTGIEEECLDSHGMPLSLALDEMKRFCREDFLWSWGKDELNVLGVSCFVQGVVPPFSASQFGNARSLLLNAGFSQDWISSTSSGTLCERLGVSTPSFRGHDASDDALSLALGVRHLLKTGSLEVSSLF